MDRSADILSFIRDLGIPHAIYEHEPKNTIEDCLNTPGLNPETTTVPRNVFLTNRQQTAFYLLLMPPKKPYQTRVVSKLLGVSRLSFAPPTHLTRLLQTEPGAVSPLNLIFDHTHQVRLIIDEELTQHERLWFHPGNNTSSLEIRTDHFLHRFLPGIGTLPTLLSIPVTEGD